MPHMLPKAALVDGPDLIQQNNRILAQTHTATGYVNMCRQSARLPTHINITGGSVGLSKDSVILLEQIRTIDKRRLREYKGHTDDAHMAMVAKAIVVSLGLNDMRQQ